MKLKNTNYDKIKQKFEEDLRGLVACDHMTKSDAAEELKYFRKWAKEAESGEIYYFDNNQYVLELDEDTLIELDGTCINMIDKKDEYAEVLADYTGKIYKEEDYPSPQAFLDDAVFIEYFPNSTFHTLLQRYFEEQGLSIEEVVRGYVPYKRGFIMTHGGGYAWLAVDLLGYQNDSSTEQEFKKWIINQGYKLVW